MKEIGNMPQWNKDSLKKLEVIVLPVKIKGLVKNYKIVKIKTTN